jgi:hypothetical protein
LRLAIGLAVARLVWPGDGETVGALLGRTGAACGDIKAKRATDVIASSNNTLTSKITASRRLREFFMS